MSACPAILIDGLAKYFGAVVGVEGLSLQVERGEVFGFLGANGAGKTTTIRLLLDLLRPARGSAAVLGFDCQRQSLQARRQIGYLPGELPVYPDLTAAGYLEFLSRIDDRPVSEDYRGALLRRLDVSDVDLRRRLRDQSHGMKQKIGIVSALMAAPPVVILDEPTAGLDPFMVQAFREILVDLRQRGDTTVFLSSHDLAEVNATCDRVGIIRAGRMSQVTRLEELRRRSLRKVTIRFSRPVQARPLPDGSKITTAEPMWWEVEVEGPLGALLSALAGLPVSDLEEEPFSLEDHLLELYRNSAVAASA